MNTVRPIYDPSTYGHPSWEWELHDAYRTVHALGRTVADPDVTTPRFLGVEDRIEVIRDGWLEHPQAGAAWLFTEAAVHDFRLAPEFMLALIDLLDSQRPDGIRVITPVQLRLLRLAGQLTGHLAAEQEPVR
ncbi:hypothetical protein [Nocardia transvalensis]|uniref:hypothetical protein n=1 Tax=Nocardia transvalensis TaxID=37333 RepID=UPI001895EA46|nr:hypothetical protein [Nocardia transvalensis]MBF6333670.1 hypothetical protein [Nocardia transvalensis]